jgi:hypothetical protein
MQAGFGLQSLCFGFRLVGPIFRCLESGLKIREDERALLILAAPLGRSTTA